MMAPNTPPASPIRRVPSKRKSFPLQKRCTYENCSHWLIDHYKIVNYAMLMEKVDESYRRNGPFTPFNFDTDEVYCNQQCLQKHVKDSEDIPCCRTEDECGIVGNDGACTRCDRWQYVRISAYEFRRLQMGDKLNICYPDKQKNTSGRIKSHGERACGIVCHPLNQPNIETCLCYTETFDLTESETDDTNNNYQDGGGSNSSSDSSCAKKRAKKNSNSKNSKISSSSTTTTTTTTTTNTRQLECMEHKCQFSPTHAVCVQCLKCILLPQNL